MNKHHFIRQHFDHLAGQFERVNQFITLGLINSWRKEFSRFVQFAESWKVLDIGTAEGLNATAIIKKHPGLRVIGLDSSRKMLSNNSLTHRIQGDIETPPFRENFFDAATCAFGFRNFNNLENAIDSIRKILKPGGILYLIEFSSPSSPWVRLLYHYYVKKVIPRLGKLLTNDAAAYTYLSESLIKFPAQADFLALMKQSDFNPVVLHTFTYGIVTMYAFQKVS